MKLALRIEGEYAREVVEAEGSSQGWDMLALMVDEYLAVLKKDESLAHEHDKWDMFREELVARSLKPWEDFGLIEAPSKRLWGVERNGKR